VRPATTSDYRPFPNRARRNWTQWYVELPVMSTALGLPRGARLLEVGCGRGVALSYFGERLRPARLVGLDVEGTAELRLRRRAGLWTARERAC